MFIRILVNVSFIILGVFAIFSLATGTYQMPVFTQALLLGFVVLDWCSSKGFVQCDDHCMAKEDPVNLEEHKETLDHYKSHSCLRGCSHGN